jgi:hypothetical protein
MCLEIFPCNSEHNTVLVNLGSLEIMLFWNFLCNSMNIRVSMILIDFHFFQMSPKLFIGNIFNSAWAHSTLFDVWIVCWKQNFFKNGGFFFKGLKWMKKVDSGVYCLCLNIIYISGKLNWNIFKTKN